LWKLPILVFEGCQAFPIPLEYVFSWEAHKMALNLAPPEIFLTLRASPYFFHIPFIAIQRTLVGHSGNAWERWKRLIFHWLLAILASFWVSCVIVTTAQFRF
jgi:hypothetical protein